MSSSNDDIVFTESRNLNEEINALDSIEEPTAETETKTASNNTFEKQGIEILKNSDNAPAKNKTWGQFSKELLDDDGIEIIRDKGDSDL